MNQRDIRIEVQALWLQYSGLRTEPAGKYDWIENAARNAGTSMPSAELPETPGLMVAT